MRSRRAVWGLALVLFALSAGPASTQRPEPRAPLLAGIRAHLAALQAIADRNGGNRAAGTAGYDQSARYVAARMRAAGYRVRVQEFSYLVVEDRSPPTLRPVAGADWPFRANRDYASLRYSGSGSVEGEVVAVDLRVPSPAPDASTSGCEAADFEHFPRGSVALLQRGTCTFRQKVENAVAAGASAAIVFNEGSPGRRDLYPGTLGSPQVRIPALAASTEVGDSLRNGVRDGRTGRTVVVSADAVSQRRRTRNVIADGRVGDRSDLVVVGAHLDSVADGPGINDNGSGSALILELAEQMASSSPRNALRFVWWGAEEVGLLGSRHYVSRLSPTARRRHALYLNFDMVASPNFGIFVYDGDGSEPRSPSSRHPGSAAIEQAFADYFSSRRLAFRETGLGGGSDHVPFDRARIPVGGIFTGAAASKSAAQASAFGGRAGRPYDPCYHRSCDTVANTSSRALARVARAAAHVVRHFAGDVSSLGRRSG